MKGLAKFLLFVFGVLFLLIHFWIGSEDDLQDYAAENLHQCTDVHATDSILMKYSHGRGWKEYFSNTDFCSIYDVSFHEVDYAETNRNSINVPYWIDEADYWQQVYSALYVGSKDHLRSLQDSLLLIGQQRNLDHDAFATMVVAFVQDIPYEYVLPEECTGNEVSPCNGNVAFGIYSPVEFLGKMHGDCDTRTVLLYTLLRNFGYQPLIINSHEYLHSMLALDVASSGDDFEYKGKRYAYWETTNVGWLAGMLPPDMNNKD